MERHIRLKHKSDLDENNSIENNPPAKIPRLADNSLKQGFENNRCDLGKYEHVPYVKKEGESSHSEEESDQIREEDAELGNNNDINSNKVLYVNKACV